MVGMTPEKLLDALAVDAKLFFGRKEDADKRECQLAFGIGRGRAATRAGAIRRRFMGS
jgi:hypothetical protein